MAALGEEEQVTYGPMLAIAIVLGYTLSTNKYRLFLLFGILSIIIGFIAGLRRELAVAAISIISTLFLLSLQKPAKLIKLSFIVSFLGIFIVLSYSSFSEYIKENSHFLYDRVIMKTESLFNGQSNSGDDNRMKYIKKFILSPEEYLIPTGFVNKQFGKKDLADKTPIDKKDSKVGSYNDIPIRELADMLSIFLAYPLIIYFSYCSFRIYCKVKRKLLPQQDLTMVSCFIVMFSLLFLEGSYFTFPYCAPYTGYVLGYIHKHACIKLTLNRISQNSNYKAIPSYEKTYI